MRGRLRAFGAIAAAATVAAVGIVGCADDGDGSGDEAASTTTESTGDPRLAPAAFATGVAEGWGIVGATDDHLVGLGGPAASDDRFGQVFDLATGSVVDVGPPEAVDDRPVQFDDAVFAAEAVVVSAFVYAPGFDPDTDIPPHDSGFVPPTEQLTYRLDPRTVTWEPLALPPGYEGRERRPLDLVPHGVDSAVGRFQVLGDDRAIFARATDDGWEQVGERLEDDLSWASFCATGPDLWQLVEGPAAHELRATALGSGTVRDVALPTRLTDEDWEATYLGCSADAVVIAVSDTFPRGGPPDGPGHLPPTVYSSPDGEDWTEAPDAFGTTSGLPQTASHGVGPGVVVTITTALGDGPPGHPAVLGPSGASAPLPGPDTGGSDALPAVYAPRGARPEVLVLDPATVDGDTVPIEVVAVPT